MDKYAIIMKGLPGSGKTTMVQKLIEIIKAMKKSYKHNSADFSHVNKDGVYDFKPQNIETAHNTCLKSFVRGLEDEIDFLFVDNTNTQRWEYSPYYALAKAYGYIPVLVHVVYDKEACKKENIHGVPERTVETMAKRFENALPFHNEIVVARDFHPEKLIEQIKEMK